MCDSHKRSNRSEMSHNFLSSAQKKNIYIWQIQNNIKTIKTGLVSARCVLYMICCFLMFPVFSVSLFVLYVGLPMFKKTHLFLGKRVINRA